MKPRRNGNIVAQFICFKLFPWLAFLTKKTTLSITEEDRKKIDSLIGRTVLFLPNHQSYLDVPAVINGIGWLRLRKFGVKAIAFNGLFKAKFLGISMAPLLSSLGAIPINVTGRQALQRAEIEVKNGNSILMFPEGQRTPNGELQEPKRGPFVLSKKTKGILILPIYLDGAYQAWPPNGNWLQGPHTITIKIGNPIEADQHDEESLKLAYTRELQHLRNEYRSSSQQGPPPLTPNLQPLAAEI